jgi:hypothetical protein
VSSFRSSIGVLVAVILLAGVATADAQQPARIYGSVQWIAGDRMQVMTDGATSVSVDLGQADQSSYRDLRNGDWVTVGGVISPDRRRLIARDIWRDNGQGFSIQSP